MGEDIKTKEIINEVFHAKYLRVRLDEEKGIRCLAEKISILINRLFSSFGIKRFKCPVCGKRSYTARGAFEICPECGWEDEGIDDEEPVFGPNGDYTIREYREEYLKKKEEDPSYNWWKSVQDDD